VQWMTLPELRDELERTRPASDAELDPDGLQIPASADICYPWGCSRFMADQTDIMALYRSWLCVACALTTSLKWEP
jgi:hypothetical protein